MSTAPRELRFVCTDRGTHPTRELAVVSRNADDDDSIILPTDRTFLVQERLRASGHIIKARGARTTEGRGESLADILWEIRCPTCGRNVEWRDDRLVAIVDSLLSAGRVTVDLSALPARLQ